MGDEKIFLHLLNNFPEFGPARLKRLLNHFRSSQRAFESSEKELQLSGIEENLVSKFKDFRRKVNIEKEVNRLKQEAINILEISDNEYPEILKEIHNPPVILYYKGSVEIKQKTSLAIVGSRKMSNYGRQVIESLLPPLFNKYSEKMVIVSGLALGVDSQAHITSLRKRQKTLAILGSGLDERSIFPYQNKKLAQEIINSRGALISEFPPGSPPLRHHFPQRNRIISGLSQAVLLVEAETRSGSLITARLALEQDREVLAVPGNIFSELSKGTNRLIQEGARPIDCQEELAQSLNLTPKQKSSTNKNYTKQSNF